MPLETSFTIYELWTGLQYRQGPKIRQCRRVGDKDSSMNSGEGVNKSEEFQTIWDEP